MAEKRQIWPKTPCPSELGINLKLFFKGSTLYSNTFSSLWTKLNEADSDNGNTSLKPCPPAPNQIWLKGPHEKKKKNQNSVKTCCSANLCLEKCYQEKSWACCDTITAFFVPQTLKMFEEMKTVRKVLFLYKGNFIPAYVLSRFPLCSSVGLLLWGGKKLILWENVGKGESRGWLWHLL